MHKGCGLKFLECFLFSGYIFIVWDLSNTVWWYPISINIHVKKIKWVLDLLCVFENNKLSFMSFFSSYLKLTWSFKFFSTFAQVSKLHFSVLTFHNFLYIFGVKYKLGTSVMGIKSRIIKKKAYEFLLLIIWCQK